MLTIERVENGWVVKRAVGSTRIFFTIEDMLFDVFSAMDPTWQVGDRVQVIRHEGP